MKRYDITFVLPIIQVGFPPGGYDIVYRLASSIKRKNLECAIIFPVDLYKYIPDYVRNNNNKMIYLAYKAFTGIFYAKRFNYIFKYWEFINKLFLKTDYFFNMLRNVDSYIYGKVEEVKFKTKLMIATGWETAYFVKEYIKINMDTTPLYFIQNSEDAPSFTKLNSQKAKETYALDFKKIVINKKLLNRFKDDKPEFMHIGVNTDFYHVINPLNKRECIIFPLRKNESKGAIFALECIKKLLSIKINRKIVAFGDYLPDELPEYVKNKIIYYYHPSNETLLKIYNDGEIFVLPSLVEGMPSPPLEAMSCGCAVIVTDNGGVNEYIEDQINGLMCPIKNSNCLFEKILYLINNEKIKDEIITNALETAKKFTYQKMAEQFFNIIEKYL